MKKLIDIMRFAIPLILIIFTGSLFALEKNVSSTWVATDALGRKLPGYKDVGDIRQDKFVAMFYWTWHGPRHADNGHANTEQIIKKYPDAVNDFDHKAWINTKGVAGFHWSEPLFGYYRTTDPWILRKHGEMLSDAGVDVVIFDCTNPVFTWKQSYDVLMKTWSEARRNGTNTPQVAFMCPFGASNGSLATIKEIYNDVYKQGRFRDLWFYWNGKPLIMAYPDNVADPIRSFFTFRPGQPDYRRGPQRKDDWSWLEAFPQNGYVEYGAGKFEMAAVGVAQNATDKLAPAAMNDKGQVYGRSYTRSKGFDRRQNACLYGLNFQEQWDRVLELDPKLVFVTGWNEWIAGRHRKWQGTENAFPDQFNIEYSRDIEPTKTVIGDNYYYQLISNIRKFKGVKKLPDSSPSKSIRIGKDFSQWQQVTPLYADHKDDTMHRNHRGYGKLVYKNKTGRNDFIHSRVTGDKDNLYFYVETAETITDAKDSNWMMLLIDIDRDKKTGWQGYDFLINRNRISKNRVSVEKNLNNKWQWDKIGMTTFHVKDKQLELSIPKKAIFEKPTNMINIEFKWADNIKSDGDIMDFYVSGDVAPSGRFNYQYTAK